MEFSWGTSLGVAVALFLLIGALYVFIGVATPFFADREEAPDYLLTGRAADTALFGRPAGEVLAEAPDVRTLRRVLIRWVAALLVGIGSLELAVAWFGLRAGERWALLALFISGLVMLPVTYLSYAPFREASASIALSEWPPYQWIPAVLIWPATAMGLLGLRS